MRPVGVVRALALTALVLASGALAQSAQTWDELAGSGARTGAAFLPSATLDVVGHRDLFGNDTVIDLQYSKGLVATPHGLVALAEREDGTCVLLHVGPDAVEESELDGCDEGTLTAYDRVNDRILVCSEAAAAEPVLQSREAASGELAWGLRPVALAVDGAESNTWACGGTAIDSVDGVAYVALWAEPRAAPPMVQIVRVRITSGEVDWSVGLGAAAFVGGGMRGYAVNDVRINGGNGGFMPIGISVTDNGIVVSGRVSCACGKWDPLSLGVATQQGAVAWLDKQNGDLNGAVLAEDDPRAMEDDLPKRNLGQWWATTQGPVAAFLLGEWVMVVNPNEHEPVRRARFRGVETGPEFTGITPSAWWSDRIVVPVGRSVTAIDAVTLKTEWSWSAGTEWVVSSQLIVPPSDVLVLAVSNANGTTADNEAVIHRLDLATGHELQRVPLPATIPTETGTGRARFQPMPDGTLLLYTMDGGLFTFGPADPALVPRVSVSDAYPASGAPVTLAVAAPRADANHTITWGDGALMEGGASWTHRYGGDGTRTARVTAVFADGRTATAETLVRVGATPPPQLTAVQRAFAPENQDLTFGVLGLALTLAGGGIALFTRRRRHSRLREDLLALDGIRERGREDPEGAVLALGAYRGRLFADLEAGRVDDTQFHTLEARADATFGALRTRLLGPLAGRLTADFRHALDVVLHDGRVDADELAALRRALEEERHVTPRERARLLALLERLGRGA